MKRFWDWLTETYRWRCLWSVIRYFPGFVKRWFEYAPIIWRDADWDWGRALLMLQYKIKRMRKEIGTYGHHENPENDLKNMDEAIELLKRVTDCDYCQGDFDAHMAKWNKNGEWFKTVETEDGRWIQAPRSEEEHAEFKVLCDKMTKAEEDDWNVLWSLLSRELRNWWD